VTDMNSFNIGEYFNIGERTDVTTTKSNSLNLQICCIALLLWFANLFYVSQALLECSIMSTQLDCLSCLAAKLYKGLTSALI